jgi:hypothetical protein
VKIKKWVILEGFREYKRGLEKGRKAREEVSAQEEVSQSDGDELRRDRRARRTGQKYGR